MLPEQRSDGEWYGRQDDAAIGALALEPDDAFRVILLERLGKSDCDRLHLLEQRV